MWAATFSSNCLFIVSLVLSALSVGQTDFPVSRKPLDVGSHYAVVNVRARFAGRVAQKLDVDRPAQTVRVTAVAADAFDHACQLALVCTTQHVLAHDHDPIFELGHKHVLLSIHSYLISCKETPLPQCPS